MNREITVTQDDYKKYIDSIRDLYKAQKALEGLGDYLDNADAHIRKAALFEPIENLIGEAIKVIQELNIVIKGIEQC